jgi:PAS domain S-box-containing protein
MIKKGSLDKCQFQNTENVETLFNVIQDFLFILDEAGNIIQANASVFTRLEYAPDELIGQSFLMLHPHKQKDQIAKILQLMLNKGNEEIFTIPMITKYGHQIPVETRLFTSGNYRPDVPGFKFTGST